MFVAVTVDDFPQALFFIERVVVACIEASVVAVQRHLLGTMGQAAP